MVSQKNFDYYEDNHDSGEHLQELKKFEIKMEWKNQISDRDIMKLEYME